MSGALHDAVRVIRASLRVGMTADERVEAAREVLHRAGRRATPEERRSLVEAMARASEDPDETRAVDVVLERDEPRTPEARRTRLRELAAPVALAAMVHGVGSPEHVEARAALDAALDGTEARR